MSVSGRRSWFLWSVLMGLAVMLAYVLPAHRLGHQVVLPLDDVYIHFQYAKQIANGQLYVYNPDLPPSSGATSLLYPYLLAVGYRLGFTGFALGYWALAIGFVAFVGSIYFVIRIQQSMGLPTPLAVAMSGVFALTGAVGWHFFSGMETGLLIFFMLLVLYALLQKRWRVWIFAASMLVIIRPEGSIMGLLSVGAALWIFRAMQPIWSRGILLLPMLLFNAQPTVNWLITGSREAAGSSAKSILSMIPTDYMVMFEQISGNFFRMWWEFATGYSSREGIYLPFGLAIVGVVGWTIGAYRRKDYAVGLLVWGWLLALTAAVSTLDPAFWHFKRYQMPAIVLLLVVSGMGLVMLYDWKRWIANSLVGFWSFMAVLSMVVYFVPAYQLNIQYLLDQQIPMAQWLSENTPESAVVAVHDVGMMRYVGNRTTVDMVGLTTAGAAESWRHGPGALAEFLSSYTPRPDYTASYTDALGLSYLADTGIYGELLAEYPVILSDRFNVALAGAYQGIWRVDWSAADVADTPKQPYVLGQLDGFSLVDQLNVADLSSERAHDYVWTNFERLAGFPTEVYEMDYAACVTDCRVMDGGRRVNGDIEFAIDVEANKDTILVTRVHPYQAGTWDVYANDEWIAERVIPNMPGVWMDVAVLVPAEYVTETTHVRIVPNVPQSHFMPYYHWVYQGAAAAFSDDVSLVSFEAFDLIALSLESAESQQLQVDLQWSVSDSVPNGDYRMFVHVYDDMNAPPLAQTDRYPVDGATPIGNWLIGTLNDTIMVNLDTLPDGEYTVALGFYHAIDGTRLQPSSNMLDVLPDGRIVLGEIKVES